jgi:hypothetical protein
VNESKFTPINRDGFTGESRPEWLEALTERRLSGLAKEVMAATEGVLIRKRHQVVVLNFEYDGKTHAVAVKYFGKQPSWKDRYDHTRGSKAARSFQAAAFLQEHGVATPPPIAYLERWKGQQLVESFYLSDYLGELESFKTALLKLYASNGPCAKLVNLLEDVGTAMRRMHDAGFCHRDLGNQNIELLKDPASGKHSVYFLDLNRGRMRTELSLVERAQDFSRLKLPSAFFDILIRIYWQSIAPAEFSRELAKSRRRFDWWQKSRRLRHPLQTLRKARKAAGKQSLKMKDVWIWDDRSGQAAITLNKADRKQCHSWLNHLKVGYSSLKAVLGIKRIYAQQMTEAFKQPVSMAGRVGMCLEPADIEFEKQFELLAELADPVPVLIRIGHHQGQEQWDRSLKCLDQLREAGHTVSVAVLQDRRAVLEPQSWGEFLEYLFARLEGKVELVEVGHVINRVKWGIHNMSEYNALMRPLVSLRKKYPSIHIGGPACIDFEMHYTVTALDNLPKGLRFDALSHHLYVDRRGAPENLQGRFGSVEKAALLKAAAIHAKQCDARVIVSEVNWPLVDTGVWSPVAASYLLNKARISKVHVSETQYGHYMIRYLALVLCSGFVDQIFWWRLVSHGFGLVDERAAEGWQRRVGFPMLQTFLKEIGNATFIEQLPTPSDVYALRFKREKDWVTLIWCNGRTFNEPWPTKVDKILDSQGNEIEATDVGEAPIYLVTNSAVKG